MVRDLCLNGGTRDPMAKAPDTSSRPAWRFTYFPVKSSKLRERERAITILLVVGTVWWLVASLML